VGTAHFVSLDQHFQRRTREKQQKTKNNHYSKSNPALSDYTARVTTTASEISGATVKSHYGISVVVFT
jgi:hypothetical protein